MTTSIFNSSTNEPTGSTISDFLSMSNQEEEEITKSQNLLLDVTHAISLIIVEERRQLHEQEVNSTKIGHFLHSKLIIDKIINHNNNEINNSNISKSLYSIKVAKTKIACSCSSSYYYYSKNKLPSNLKLKIGDDDINCSIDDDNNNGDEQLRQCQIASKLKLKIEKCILDHLLLKNQKEESFLRHHYQEFKPNSKINFQISQILYNNFKIQSNIEIQVYLLTSCCFSEFISKQANGSNLVIFDDRSSTQQNLDLSTYNAELLECWNISMITTTTPNKDTNNNETLLNNNLTIKTTNSILTLNQLFQAIRSYLHFSQISSWISKTKEINNNNNNFSNQSKNIVFSIKYSNSEATVITNDQKQQSQCNEFLFLSPTTTSPTTPFPQEPTNTKSENKRLATTQFDFQTFPQFSSTTHFNNNNNKRESVLSVNLYSRKRKVPILNPESDLLASICRKHTMAATTNTSTMTADTPQTFKINANANKLSYSPLTPTTPTSSSLLFSFQDDMKKSLSQGEDLLPLDTSESVFVRKLTKQVNIPIDINLIKSHTKSHSNFPLSSSPAPMRKSGTCLFDFDNSLKNPRSIKNALAVVNALNLNDDTEIEVKEAAADRRNNLMRFSNSNSNFNSQWPVTPNCLLGTFEESLLNGRMNPVGLVDGFYAEIGASGSFFPPHEILPVNASFYQVCEDIAASPYLGVLKLDSLGKRGYKVPNRGTIQVTLFNPNNTVVKMFVVMYDLSDMPPNNRTFLRQRTMYVPTNLSSAKDQGGEQDDNQFKSYLRYLIHLRFATTKSGKMYLHSDIKLIFARNKCEIDPRLACYEYKTSTEAPKNPKYSPKK